MKRGQRAGVEDRWHRLPRRDEQVTFPADAPGSVAGTWCMDGRHGTPGTKVCTARHGTGLRWLARWVPDDGNETSASYERQADAQARVNQVTADVVGNTYVDRRRSSVTFRTISDEWFETQRKKLKPSTVAGYQSLLTATVHPRWGEVSLSEIKHADIQAWVNWLTTSQDARQPRSLSAERNAKRAPLSARRAIQALGIVKQILAYAMRTRRLAVNPADGVERPRVKSREETALSHSQVAGLVANAGDAGPIIQTLAYTGMRFGELVALRVADVDLKRRRIRVNKAVAQVAGSGLVQDTPKTHQGRMVPILTSGLKDTLTAVVGNRAASEYLFPAPDGGPMRNSYFRWRFRSACAAAELSGISIKTLRHTAGSLAIQSGASVVTTSKLLGHRDVTTTMNIYSHLLPDDFDRLAEAMDKATT